MDYIGRRNTNGFAQIMYILHYSLLVYIDYEFNSDQFFWLSLLSQFFGAMGAGAFSTSTHAIVASLDEE